VTATDSPTLSEISVSHTTILLAGVNDAPVITAPSHIVATEDTIYSIANVRVSDVDFFTNQMLSAILTVTVTCEHGQIKMSGKFIHFKL
jgi:hypothetical protein